MRHSGSTMPIWREREPTASRARGVEMHAYARHAPAPPPRAGPCGRARRRWLASPARLSWRCRASGAATACARPPRAARTGGGVKLEDAKAVALREDEQQVLGLALHTTAQHRGARRAWCRRTHRRAIRLHHGDAAVDWHVQERLQLQRIASAAKPGVAREPRVRRARLQPVSREEVDLDAGTFAAPAPAPAHARVSSPARHAGFALAPHGGANALHAVRRALQAPARPLRRSRAGARTPR